MKKLFKSGDIFLWFTAATLGAIIMSVLGLLFVVSLNGVGVFWPASLAEISLKNGSRFIGEITVEENSESPRIQIKTGNRDIYGTDFKWLPSGEINSLSYPEDIMLVERREFGPFLGRLISVEEDGRTIASGNEAWNTLDNLTIRAQKLLEQKSKIEKYEIGSINSEIERLRLEIKRLKFYGELDSSRLNALDHAIGQKQNEYTSLQKTADDLAGRTSGLMATFSIADGTTKKIHLDKIIRFADPNRMGIFEKWFFYFSKVGEYLFDEPRESNMEGGVFPAIFGTVMMSLLMTIFVVPFGVVAALYLREYAHQGWLVQLIRIAVNNLAGVPSIVFGIFGLGFFVYACGGTLDHWLYPERLPSPTWGTGGILWASLTLSLLTVPVVIVATEEALTSVPKGVRDASLALGATKWQTTWKIVLPASTPGILTGMILAMARGAGEVAPLMITGVVKLAPNLPLDANFPFFHLDRKFMHLGFHIYDVGFQSPNVEAAKPMVFMTALLLITIVLLLNLTAIIIRARLRKKYQGSTF